jgi:hypothetical protein
MFSDIELNFFPRVEMCFFVSQSDESNLTLKNMAKCCTLHKCRNYVEVGLFNKELWLS